MQRELILKDFNELKKAVSLLNASIEGYIPYDVKKEYTSKELEFYDSLSFRFEKAVELSLNFMRGLEYFLNSAASDTLRDRLLIIEKIDLIENKEVWFEMRLLRNKIAHAYLPEEIKDIYENIRKNAHIIFNFVNKAFDFIDKHSNQ